jgi:UDP-N-acetyl-D-mannosaminuronic acid transferase (WecB/TagA/CpsF family)
VLRSDVFEGAVTRPTNPAQQISQLPIMFVGSKNRIVRALVNEVSRDYHSVAQKQHAGYKSDPAAFKQ